MSDHEEGQKQSAVSIVTDDQQWGSVMSVLLTFIYREYCRARLAEMREQDLAALSHRTPEATAS